MFLHIIHMLKMKYEGMISNNFPVHQLKLPTVFAYPFLVGPLYE